MFKVGDRVIPNNSLANANQIAIVTELTARGFKWKLEGDPICIHPLYGSYSEGECFMPETYRLALDSEKPVLMKDVTMTVTTSREFM